jgi:anti-anti-sigma factor
VVSTERFGLQAGLALHPSPNVPENHGGAMASSPHGAKTLETDRIGAAPPLQIDAEPAPRGVRVRVHGEVDLATVGSIRRTIDECVAGGCERLVLDLQGVRFLDCAGVHLALETDAAARAAGWELLLIPAPASVHRVFEIAGVADRLPFVEASHALAVPRTADGRRA